MAYTSVENVLYTFRMQLLINKKILTFDCYGTLIDWDSGIQAFLKMELSDFSLEQIEELRKKWEEIQFSLILGPYIPYEDLLQESFQKTFATFGYAYKKNLGKKLVKKITAWKPFPDDHTILSELQKRYQLAIISNGPQAILKKNALAMNIHFDKILSAEQIQAYKPSYRIFHYALDALGRPKNEILHIAAGYKYDILPTNALGITNVWINRKREPLPTTITPDYEVFDLFGLKQLLQG